MTSERARMGCAWTKALLIPTLDDSLEAGRRAPGALAVRNVVFVGHDTVRFTWRLFPRSHPSRLNVAMREETTYGARGRGGEDNLKEIRSCARPCWRRAHYLRSRPPSSQAKRAMPAADARSVAVHRATAPILESQKRGKRGINTIANVSHA